MPTDTTLEALKARITELEIKQSYYESGHEALDQAVIGIQSRLDELANEINKLKLISASRSEQPIAPMSEPPPPLLIFGTTNRARPPPLIAPGSSPPESSREKISD